MCFDRNVEGNSVASSFGALSRMSWIPSGALTKGRCLFASCLLSNLGKNQEFDIQMTEMVSVVNALRVLNRLLRRRRGSQDISHFLEVMDASYRCCSYFLFTGEEKHLYRTVAVWRSVVLRVDYYCFSGEGL